MSSTPLITAEILCFRYQGEQKDALGPISFTLEKGSLYNLLGLNGSGKSTLLALLAGVYAPTSGTLRAGGMGISEKNSPLRGKCALVPQDPDTYILGSLAREDLLLGLNPHDTEAASKALDLAQEMGLADFLDQPPHTLSHGQKRKLCLASALAGQPDLLLLDEPFAGLDHPSALFTRQALMRNKQAGITQVITGHDLDLTADISDVFLLMQNGLLIKQGGAAEVFPLLQTYGVRPPCWWFSSGTRGCF